MSVFWWALLIIFLVIIWFVVLTGSLNAFEDREPVGGTILAVLGIVMLAGAIAWGAHLIRDLPQDPHMWKGGNGPATMCHYEEVRQNGQHVGKVYIPAHNVTWTVCE